MIRTQIFLTPRQHVLLKKQARAKNVTVSAVIRESIDKHLQKDAPVQQQTVGNWLQDMADAVAKLHVKGPADLATNMDEYLYGNKK